MLCVRWDGIWCCRTSIERGFSRVVKQSDKNYYFDFGGNEIEINFNVTLLKTILQNLFCYFHRFTQFTDTYSRCFLILSECPSPIAGREQTDVVLYREQKSQTEGVSWLLPTLLWKRKVATFVKLRDKGAWLIKPSHLSWKVSLFRYDFSQKSRICFKLYISDNKHF